MPHFDFESLSLTEVVQLQNELSKVLQRRFGRELALCFSDVVGSTAYFQRFGNEIGRRLTQRAVDLVSQVVASMEGRIVDTAGDGVFYSFPSVELAANALIKLEELIAVDNARYEHEHQLVMRSGLHWGMVLTDGDIVTGDPVNLCARIASAAAPGEINLSSAALQKLPAMLRLRCNKDLQPLALKGIKGTVQLYTLEWRDLDKFPNRVRIEETAEEITLPNLDLIRFGRLDVQDGRPANEVVLQLPDPEQTKKISRWHFALRRHPNGYRLHQVSPQLTQVDGKTLPAGEEAPIAPGTVVSLSEVITLKFVSGRELDEDRTTLA